jgi:acetyltransferase-like isoleucine patch superfamily enzyme
MDCSVEYVVLRLKRADTPFFRRVRKAIDFCWTATLPVPSILKPVGRLLYGLRFYIPILWSRFKSIIYTTPIFSCRCESVGRHLQVCALPQVQGHALLYIGDDVRFSGSLSISSGKFNSGPTLRIGSRTFIGHNVSITCNREVIIEDDVLIAAGCRITDYDGHPSSLEKRVGNGLPAADDIQPVRICKGAWIGAGALILKGVTVGVGGIVGANSVVTHDVPPYCVVAGAPAKLVKRTVPPRSTVFETTAAAA